MSNENHVLIVDDDDRLRSLLKRFLAAHDYRVSVANSAKKARRLLKSMDFDIAIIDIMMPDEDGLSLLTSLREEGDLPVILLTARDLAEDRIEGLRRGADDYLTKPFEPEELSLRIASILRRAPSPAEREVPVHMSGLTFYPSRGLLQSDDKSIHLTESERRLLGQLAKSPREAVERHILAAQTSTGLERSVDVQVTRLRKKIERDPRKPIHLQTVRGVGYRLMPD